MWGRGRALIALMGGCFIAATPTATAEQPQIRITPDLPTGWLTGGTYPLKIGVSTPVGIESALVTGPTILKRKSDAFFCALDSAPGLCFDRSFDYVLRPLELRDGRGELVVAVRDALSVTWTARFPLRVDHTAPAPVGDLAVRGAQGWRAQNAFDVSWSPPPADQGSPIAAAQYELCPLSGAGDCLAGTRAIAAADGLNAITAPQSGAWRLRVALRDEAGNVDLGSGPSTTLMLDSAPPTAELLHDPSGDPARIALRADDAESGVAEATIEARRQGDDTWHVLNVAHSGAVSGVLDDAALPAGTYTVRGRVVDAVGNERTVGTRADGSPVTVQLPVRQATSIHAGIRASGSRRLDSRPLIAFGSTPLLRGNLTDELGRPLSGAPVDVTERSTAPGARWRPLTTVRTGTDGGLAYRAPRGPARTLRFSYVGSPTMRAASTEVTLRVRARTTLTASKRKLRNGDSVILRGRLSGREVPATGKLLTLQARVPGGWRTFGTARARVRDGRWRYRYTFTNTSRTTRYSFRVVIPAEASYPYAQGTSKRLNVVVRGPA